MDFASFHTESLLSLLKKYKLRNQVEITNVSEEFTQFQIWGPNVDEIYLQRMGHKEVRSPLSGALTLEKSPWTSACIDPRAPGMGIRVVVVNGSECKC